MINKLSMADEIKIKYVVDDSQLKASNTNVQKGLAATAAAAVKTDSSLGKLTTGSAQAGQSLTNLGRIVQDAPFGFIGIQNNIDPLFQSFRQLKIETGSTSSAFKALGSSLIGGAGVGLAISAVTSGLTLLAQNGFFATSKAANAAAEQAKKFKEEIKGIAEDAAKEQANVLILVKALESDTLARREKLAALKELQSINPKYFGDLKLEEGLVVGLAAAYNKYKDAIIASIQNKIDTKKLEDVLEKINTATEQQQQQAIFAASNQKRINSLVAAGGKEYVKTLENVQEILTNTDKLKKLEQQRDEILARIAARNFEGQVGFNVEKVKADVQKVKEVVEKRLENVGTVTVRVPTSEEVLERLKKEIEDANKLLGKNPLILNAKINVGGSEGDSEFFKALREKVKTIQAAFDGITESAARLGSDIFSAIGKGIGDSLSEGGNILQGALEGVLHIMGRFLVQIGEAAILASTLAVAIKSIFKNPGIGLIAGIAAVALGTILQSVKLPQFAGGVQNFSGGMAIVGERGPELVNLPRGSDVIPNHRLNGLGGGAMAIEVTGTLRASGNSLVAVIDGTRRTNNRNGQAGG